MQRAPIRVFVSYSHRDEQLRQALDKHLTMLKRSGQIDTWHDRRIDPGSDLGGEIDARLNEAELVLLLVSADFLASDYCYSKEMDRAMQMHKASMARVIPIILRPVAWQDAPFGKLLALPTDGKPITKWSNRDSALLDVVEGIKSAISEFREGDDARQHCSLGSSQNLSGFAGAVLQIGGIGSRIVTTTAWILDEHGYLAANEYVTHYFNGPADLMWVNCREGFRIVRATSPTGNSVFPMFEGDDDTAFGICLLDQLQNTIIIECEAKTEPTTSAGGHGIAGV